MNLWHALETLVYSSTDENFGGIWRGDVLISLCVTNNYGHLIMHVTTVACSKHTYLENTRGGCFCVENIKQNYHISPYCLLILHSRNHYTLACREMAWCLVGRV